MTANMIDWQSETLPPLRDNLDGLDGAEILRLAAINLRKSAAELDRLADEMQPPSSAADILTRAGFVEEPTQPDGTRVFSFPDDVPLNSSTTGA